MRCDGRRMLNQKGLQWDLKGKHAHAFPLTLEAPLMRLSVASLRRVVKGDLTIQFVPQALTSYGGLELLQRYVRQIDVVARLRQAFAGLRSDYGSARLALVVMALFYVGARRLEHLRYLGRHPLVARLRGPAPAHGPRVLLRHRGRLLELAAAKAGGRRLPPLGARRPRGGRP